MKPEEIISRELKEIEKKEGVTVLFCVESGSRVWRIESEDSDYDVRFVYYRPKSEYLKINNPTDVIQKAFDKDGNKHSIEGGYIDMLGFDIFKFAKLLSSSNPSAIEWLMSDKIYYGTKPSGFSDFAYAFFNPISLITTTNLYLNRTN